MGTEDSKFNLSNEDPVSFWVSQWRRPVKGNRRSADGGVFRPTLGFMLYRISVLIFLIVNQALKIGIADDPDRRRHLPIFLTYQSLWILTLDQFCLTMLTVTKFFKEDAKVQPTTKLPSLLKFVWILDIIATPAAIVVSALYWIILYDPKEDGVPTYWNVLVHGLNSCIALLDLMVSRKPVRWQHFYIPGLYGLW